jgi:molybdate transport system regulatory protein
MLAIIMQPRAKLWLEQDGKLVLSDYRVRLLRHIDESGSLARAAAAMHISYRRAWGKLKEIEENLGMTLVERSAGGPGGGGSRLTQQGRELVESYERFRTAAERDLEQEFARAFDRPRTS